jgi:predicted Zn-dependent protease
VYKDEASRRLTNNYANGFLVVADTLRARGDIERSQMLVERAVELIPHSADAVEFLGALYSEQRLIESLNTLIATAQAGDERWLKTLLARTQRALDKNDEAEKTLSAILAADPTYRQAFDELMRLYFETDQVASMKVLLQRWLQANPNDQRMRAMLTELQRGLDRQSSPPQDSQ